MICCNSYISTIKIPDLYRGVIGLGEVASTPVLYAILDKGNGVEIMVEAPILGVSSGIAYLDLTVDNNATAFIKRACGVTISVSIYGECGAIKMKPTCSEQYFDCLSFQVICDCTNTQPLINL